MKHKLAWFSVSLICVVAAIFVWLGSSTNEATVRIGYYGIVASLIIPLLPTLEGIFEKKENPSELRFRSEHLAEPLKKIHSKLAFGARQIPDAISIFEREIESEGLLTMLKRESPLLVESMTKMKTLIQETGTTTLTRDEDLLRALSADGMTEVLRNRLANSEDARRRVEEAQKQIEDLIAKYGGFH